MVLPIFAPYSVRVPRQLQSQGSTQDDSSSQGVGGSRGDDHSSNQVTLRTDRGEMWIYPFDQHTDVCKLIDWRRLFKFNKTFGERGTLVWVRLRNIDIRMPLDPTLGERLPAYIQKHSDEGIIPPPADHSTEEMDIGNLVLPISPNEDIGNGTSTEGLSIRRPQKTLGTSRNTSDTWSLEVLAEGTRWCTRFLAPFRFRSITGCGRPGMLLTTCPASEQQVLLEWPDAVQFPYCSPTPPMPSQSNTPSSPTSPKTTDVCSASLSRWQSHRNAHRELGREIRSSKPTQTISRMQTLFAGADWHFPLPPHSVPKAIETAADLAGRHLPVRQGLPVRDYESELKSPLPSGMGMLSTSTSEVGDDDYMDDVTFSLIDGQIVDDGFGRPLIVDSPVTQTDTQRPARNSTSSNRLGAIPSVPPQPQSYDTPETHGIRTSLIIPFSSPPRSSSLTGTPLTPSQSPGPDGDVFGSPASPHLVPPPTLLCLRWSLYPYQHKGNEARTAKFGNQVNSILKGVYRSRHPLADYLVKEHFIELPSGSTILDFLIILEDTRRRLCMGIRKKERTEPVPSSHEENGRGVGSSSAASSSIETSSDAQPHSYAFGALQYFHTKPLEFFLTNTTDDEEEDSAGGPLTSDQNGCVSPLLSYVASPVPVSDPKVPTYPLRQTEGISSEVWAPSNRSRRSSWHPPQTLSESSRLTTPILSMVGSRSTHLLPRPSPHAPLALAPPPSPSVTHTYQPALDAMAMTELRPTTSESVVIQELKYDPDVIVANRFFQVAVNQQTGYYEVKLVSQINKGCSVYIIDRELEPRFRQLGDDEYQEMIRSEERRDRDGQSEGQNSIDEGNYIGDGGERDGQEFTQLTDVDKRYQGGNARLVIGSALPSLSVTALSSITSRAEGPSAVLSGPLSSWGGLKEISASHQFGGADTGTATGGASSPNQPHTGATSPTSDEDWDIAQDDAEPESSNTLRKNSLVWLDGWASGSQSRSRRGSHLVGGEGGSSSSNPGTSFRLSSALGGGVRSTSSISRRGSGQQRSLVLDNLSTASVAGTESTFYLRAQETPADGEAQQRSEAITSQQGASAASTQRENRDVNNLVISSAAVATGETSLPAGLAGLSGRVLEAPRPIVPAGPLTTVDIGVGRGVGEATTLSTGGGSGSRTTYRYPATKQIALADRLPKTLTSTFNARQFEFHPIPQKGDVMLVGYKQGDLGIVDFTQDKLLCKTSIDNSPILGLSWLRHHPDHAVCGTTPSGMLVMARWSRDDSASFRAMSETPKQVKTPSARWAMGRLPSSDTGDYLDEVEANQHSLHVVQRYKSFDQLCSVSLNCSDDYLMTSGFSRGVGLYDLRTGAHSMCEELHHGYINILRFANYSPHIFATASFDQSCKVWDLRTKLRRDHPVKEFRSATPNVMCSFSPDDRYLLCSGVDSALSQYSLPTFRPYPNVIRVPPLDTSINFRRSVYLSSCQHFITAGTDECFIRVMGVDGVDYGIIDFEVRDRSTVSPPTSPATLSPAVSPHSTLPARVTSNPSPVPFPGTIDAGTGPGPDASASGMGVFATPQHPSGNDLHLERTGSFAYRTVGEASRGEGLTAGTGLDAEGWISPASDTQVDIETLDDTELGGSASPRIPTSPLLHWVPHHRVGPNLEGRNVNQNTASISEVAQNMYSAGSPRRRAFTTGSDGVLTPDPAEGGWRRQSSSEMGLSTQARPTRMTASADPAPTRFAGIRASLLSAIGGLSSDDNLSSTRQRGSRHERWYHRLFNAPVVPSPTSTMEELGTGTVGEDTTTEAASPDPLNFGNDLPTLSRVSSQPEGWLSSTIGASISSDTQSWTPLQQLRRRPTFERRSSTEQMTAATPMDAGMTTGDSSGRPERRSSVRFSAIVSREAVMGTNEDLREVAPLPRPPLPRLFQERDASPHSLWTGDETVRGSPTPPSGGVVSISPSTDTTSVLPPVPLPRSTEFVQSLRGHPAPEQGHLIAALVSTHGSPSYSYVAFSMLEKRLADLDPNEDGKGGYHEWGE
eukprot:GHVN01068348.1.p1 GENE.GHVN01068348.1~~GHVN01068348.1.p1  ORF type:complete len:2011 (+),score=329.56 GHVN01068348.1:665-6697(+)